MTNNDATNTAYRQRLRRSMRSAIALARRRQAKKANPTPVTITLDEVMQILRRQEYRCAISGLPFWSGTAGSFSPTIPSLDRIDADKGYTQGNLRVTLLGVNALRGNGSDEQMMMIVRAIMKNARPEEVFPDHPTPITPAGLPDSIEGRALGRLPSDPIRLNDLFDRLPQ